MYSEAEEQSPSGDVKAPDRRELIGIDHLAIAVPDLEAAVTWYAGALGFRCIERRTTRGQRTGMISAVLVHGNVVVVLIQGMEPESQVSRFVSKFGPGVQHVAFGVGDMKHAMGQVKAAGGAAETQVIEGEGIRQVFLRRDPGSGVRVELIERRGGSFSDESVEELFRTFEEGDLY